MQSKWVWCLIASLAALAPVGLRLVTSHKSQPTPVDPAMAQAGAELFQHKWTAHDPLAAGGDGLGPVFNANSCVFCHSKGGTGGGGDLDANVTTYGVRAPGVEGVREGVLHKYGDDSLALVGVPGLPDIRGDIELRRIPRAGVPVTSDTLRLPRGVRISQLNTPALFGAKLIDDLPESAIIANEKAQRLRFGMAPPGGTEYPVGRATRTASGKVGRFGWKAQTASLGAFVRAACANELGLSNPSQAQPVVMSNPSYSPAGLDLTDAQCDQLTAFVGSLSRPTERPENPAQAESAKEGKKLFASVGCADCHVPDVADVKGLYSDLLLHHMGADLEGGGSYYDGPPLPALPASATDPDPTGPATPAEWRTPPLWGVADSGPYMHDGRANSLEEAIRLHTGQGAASAARFNKLNVIEQGQLVAFLKTLRAPQQ
jgi:CxxC motif-containing protein (DUF1111 family)